MKKSMKEGERVKIRRGEREEKKTQIHKNEREKRIIVGVKKECNTLIKF
jgi:hypothetical protein